MDDIGKKLKEYFDNQGITQKDIAEQLDVSRAYVNALFNGKSVFGKEQADKWGNLYGLSKSWLLTGEGEMFASPVQQNINGTHNTQIAGNNNRVSSPSMLDKAMTEIAEQRKLVAKAQEQVSKAQEHIDRLMALLEKK